MAENHMHSLDLFLLLSVVSVYGNEHSPAVEPIGPRQDASIGWCRGESGLVSLAQITYILNRELDLGDGADRNRVVLRDQTITFRRLTRDDSVISIDIGAVVARDGQDADVIITLGSYQGATVLYWRETFLHRQYRQGVFRINDSRLIPLCEGIGGEDILQ